MATRGLAILLSVAMFTAPAFAAGNVVTLLPENTLGFVVINRLSEVNEKLGRLAEKLGLPLPDLLAMAKANVGIESDLDDQGTLLIAVVPSVDGSQKIEDSEGLMALPVSDYKQFVEQSGGDASADITELNVAGQPMLVTEKLGYAVLVPSDEEHRALLQQVREKDAEVLVEIDALNEWIGQNDAAGVVLEPGIQMLTARGIVELEKVKEQFSGMKAALGAQADQVAASLDMYLQLLRALKTEVHTAADGLRIDDEGNIRWSGRVRFVEDSRLAQIQGSANSTNSNAADLLGSLPGGPFAGAMSASVSPKCGELLAEWSVSMMKNNPALYGMKLSEDAADKYYELMVASMKGFNGISMMMGPGEEGGAILDSMLGIFITEDSADYLAKYQELMAQFQQIMGESGDAVPYKMEISEAEVSGQSGFKFEMDMSAVLSAQGSPPQAVQMVERMFGDGGKLTGHILAIDKTNVLFSYGSEQTIERVLASLKSSEPGLTQEACVKKTAPLLTEDADVVGFVSPRGLVAWVKSIITTFVPPGLLGEIPEFPETPAVGFSARMVPGGLETEMVVPAVLPKAVKEFVESVRR